MPTLTEIARSILEHARKRPVGTLTLAEFADSGRIIYVWSDVLEETVIFAADNARILEQHEGVIYRAHELAAVWGEGGNITPEELLLLHTAKKAFDGVVQIDQTE